MSKVPHPGEVIRLVTTVVAAAIAVLVLALPPPAAASSPSGGCRPAGSKTIVAGKQARVFKSRGRIYGCLYRRGVRVALTDNDAYSETRLTSLRPRVAGRFVGYAYEWEGAVAGGPGVAVTDLRRGRTRRIELDPAGPGDPDANVSDVVVTPGGSLAWTWSADYSLQGGEPMAREVRKLEPRDSTGRLGVLLDSGPDIDLVSLEAKRSTVSWLKGGQRMSAKLR